MLMVDTVKGGMANKIGVEEQTTKSQKARKLTKKKMGEKV